MQEQFNTVELGDTITKITAKGRFDSKDALDFVPTPESIYLHVDTPNYDGPLDLLVHLIHKHSIDIFDIPISFITQKYLEEIEYLKELNLDIAGEFILMAATLAQIKSMMLLPKQEKQDLEAEEEDPRAELVKKILQYKIYKEAAGELSNFSQINKDFFTRKNFLYEENLYKNNQEEINAPLAKIEIFSLVENLAILLNKSSSEVVHTISRDRISISARIHELMDFCYVRSTFSFYESLKFFEAYDKIDIIVTFLAILEMCKLRLFKIEQADNHNLHITIVKENFYQNHDNILANIKDIDEG